MDRIRFRREDFLSAEKDSKKKEKEMFKFLLAVDNFVCEDVAFEVTKHTVIIIERAKSNEHMNEIFQKTKIKRAFLLFE